MQCKTRCSSALTYHGLSSFVFGDLVLGIRIVDLVHDQLRLGYLSLQPPHVLLVRLRDHNGPGIVCARRLRLAVLEAQGDAEIKRIAAQRRGRRGRAQRLAQASGSIRSAVEPQEAPGEQEQDEDGHERDEARRSSQHDGVVPWTRRGSSTVDEGGVTVEGALGALESQAA
jgi:hypothetical protein